MGTTKTNNDASLIEAKVSLRIDSLPDKKTITVLEAFGGEGVLWGIIKRRCPDRGLYEAQGGKCLLSGIPFELKRERSEFDHCLYYPFSPSIDQIVSGAGYTKENVRIICTALNLSINQWGEETYKFIAASYLTKNQSNIQ